MSAPRFLLRTILLFATVELTAATDSIVRRPQGPAKPGQAWSVTTPDVPLALTGQLLGWNDDRSFATDAGTQARRAVAQLEKLLLDARSSLGRVVKLNVYLTDDAHHETVAAALGAAFASHPVPISFVRTALHDSRALVAIDAVFQVPAADAASRGVRVDGVPPFAVGAHLGILPPGRRVFLSGAASRRKGFVEALREVFESQRATLLHHGLSPADVVQVKAWLNPLSRLKEFQSELGAFFGALPLPPVVLIEWPAAEANEIEFVLSGRNAHEGRFNGPVAFATRPGVAAPTRFSHIAFVEAGQPLIFIAGLYGRPGLPVRDQLQDMFSQLGRILFDAGSGFRYLAKATYHNVDAPGRAALGEIRDVYFDPARPPAASGVVVHGVGLPGATATLDMIAVPLPKN